MKRYELKKIADGGLLYLEESDFVEVRARKGDPLYPVEVELQNRDAYRLEEGFAYNAKRGTVTVKLSCRQARELIEQDRAATGKDFCEGCFDFGASVDPETCARCNVIRSMHLAGWGDLRKVRIPLPKKESHALTAALLMFALAFWWTLIQWSSAANERDVARAEVLSLRRQIKQQSTPLPKQDR